MLFEVISCDDSGYGDDLFWNRTCQKVISVDLDVSLLLGLFILVLHME